MRPKGYYTIFDYGRVIAICYGYRAARTLSPHRAYRRFSSRLQAEEFADWWNYEAAQRGVIPLSAELHQRVSTPLDA